MYFDMPLDELQVYKPQRHEPQDFEKFWRTSLDEARKFPLDSRFNLMNFGLKTLETYDVTFNGYGGQPIKAWLIIPRKVDKPIPCMVTYIGYGGGRGFPNDWLLWPSVGYAELVMDNRGQGSSYLKGDTADLPVEGSSAHFPGFMTLGILNPKMYYYRRLYIDAVRAVEAAHAFPDIDPQKIVANGSSQGGGLSIVVSGLVPDLAGVMADVPFLSHFERAVTITDELPYKEIQTYCKIHRELVATVFNTLSYFDIMHFATRAKARALFSAGLMDQVCPPSTVFAAYNHYAGEKRMCVYHFNQHDGGGTHHDLEKIKFLQANLDK